MSTDFNTGTIVAAGSFKFDHNVPTDIRMRVSTRSDIADIPMPFIGMQVYVIDEGNIYTITSNCFEPEVDVYGRLQFKEGWESGLDKIASSKNWQSIINNDAFIGPTGPQGPQGPSGADGESNYFHIAYANDASGNGYNQNGGDYVSTYVDSEINDVQSKFNAAGWRLFKGAQGPQGEQGIAGAAGVDGKTYYLHIAYANSADGSVDFSIGDATGRSYIGTYVDEVETDSLDHRKYNWKKYVGSDGRIMYYAGEWESGTLYEADDTSTPYVYDKYGQEGYNYFFLVGESYIGDVSPYYDQTHSWKPIPKFEAIYANVGMFDTANVGAAAFYGDYVFSQTSTTGGTNFKDFAVKADGTIDTSKFNPSIWFNFKTGAGSLAKGNISWNANGKVTLGEDVELKWSNITDAPEIEGNSSLTEADVTDIIQKTEISGTQIKTGTIEGNKIKANSIDASKLNVDSITTSKLDTKPTSSDTTGKITIMNNDIVIYNRSTSNPAITISGDALPNLSSTAPVSPGNKTYSFGGAYAMSSSGTAIKSRKLETITVDANNDLTLSPSIPYDLALEWSDGTEYGYHANVSFGLNFVSSDQTNLFRSTMNFSFNAGRNNDGSGIVLTGGDLIPVIDGNSGFTLMKGKTYDIYEVYFFEFEDVEGDESELFVNFGFKQYETSTTLVKNINIHYEYHTPTDRISELGNDGIRFRHSPYKYFETCGNEMVIQDYHQAMGFNGYGLWMAVAKGDGSDNVIIWSKPRISNGTLTFGTSASTTYQNIRNTMFRH